MRPQAQTFFSRWGLTRRLRRGWWDLQSQGAFILFFRWRKKSMQKKASGTATPGKRLLLPILTAGLAMSRAMELDSYHTGAERARARLFSADKMGGPFSLRCLSPRCPGAVGGEHTQPLQGGVCWRSLYFVARQKASGKSNPRWPLLDVYKRQLLSLTVAALDFAVVPRRRRADQLVPDAQFGGCLFKQRL